MYKHLTAGKQIKTKDRTTKVCKYEVIQQEKNNFP